MGSVLSTSEVSGGKCQEEPLKSWQDGAQRVNAAQTKTDGKLSQQQFGGQNGRRGTRGVLKIQATPWKESKMNSSILLLV